MNTNAQTAQKIDALNQMENMLGPDAKLPMSVVNADVKGFVSIENAKRALTNQAFEYENTDGSNVRCKMFTETKINNEVPSWDPIYSVRKTIAIKY